MVLLAVAVVVGLSRRGERLPLAEHRVLYDVSDRDAALWFVDRYPDYFQVGETHFAEWLEGLPEHERIFVIAMGNTLAWAWLERELEALDAEDLDGLSRQAIARTRGATLNQLEIRLEALSPDMPSVEFTASAGEPKFADEVFARLVRGATNCDGQNHVAAMLLNAELSDRKLDARARLLSIDSHMLVRVDGPELAQPLYVDAWSNLPPFVLDEQPAARGAIVEPGELPALLPGLVGREYREVEVYTRGHASWVAPTTGRRAPRRGTTLNITAPPMDQASLDRVEDRWRLYFYARVLDLYDDPRAADLYQRAIDRACDPNGPRNFVCMASIEFLARLE